jgi:uncharacterized membrane protein YjjB (DUF3815 family)
MSPLDVILNIAVSLAATAAFCFLFDIPKRHVIFCAPLGSAGWMLYILLTPVCGQVIATFAAACAAVLLSRILAVVRKCPANVLIIPGIIPLVPGSAIYYSAYSLVTGDNAQAASYGLLTLKIALAIVIGILVVSAIPFPKARSKRQVDTAGQNSIEK